MIFLCLTALLCLNAKQVMAEEYIKNIEIGESNIKMDQSELPQSAYLYVELKNNGDKNISNLNFEISYYDRDGYLIEKHAVKNALTGPLPKKETQKYRIHLNGNVINEKNAQYPYSQHDKVNEFDIKITGVKLGSK